MVIGVVRVRIILIPRKARYVAPAMRIASYTNGNDVRMAERPIAVTDMCTRVPTPIPNADTMPALLPFSMLLEMTYNMSGPGDRLRAIVAIRKRKKGSVGNGLTCNGITYCVNSARRW